MKNQSEITQSHPTTIYEAVLHGDINSLKNLLENDRLILDRCIFEKSCIVMQSPLHIAVEMGRLDIVIEILKKKPKLAEVVDQIKRSTPLHIAAAATTENGQGSLLEIVDELLKVRPNTCFVHDQDGLTPLHVAAVNGNTEVLQALVKKKRQAALERTTRGETILHLCVKNSHVNTLKELVKDTYDLELLNSEDSDGNTVLHLAVTYKEKEMVEFLLKQGDDKIDKNAMNKKNKTIQDIFDLAKSRKDEKHCMDKFKLCFNTIFRRNKEKVEAKCETEEDKSRKITDKAIKGLIKGRHTLRAEEVLKRIDDEKWLEGQNTAPMVVASCIATLSFQVGIDPPGSVWQDNDNGHEAGTSIMSSYKDNDVYNIVQVSNTIGLMSSLSVILLLISGLPCKRYFVFVLRVTLWIAVTASAATYFYAIGYLTSDIFSKEALVEAMEYSVEVWLWLMLVILLGHSVRFIWKMIGYQRRDRITKKLHTKTCTSSLC